MVGISERLAGAQDRAVPGQWEGDLIIGAGGKSAVGALVERPARFVLLLHLPDGHGAGQVAAAMTEATGGLPQAIRRSLTWDQGPGMSGHAHVALGTGRGICCCGPRSPWQPGSNENTSGLLRRYFPEGTNLAGRSRQHLDEVAAGLHSGSRDTLGWKSAA